MRGERITLTVAPDVGAALLHWVYTGRRRSFFGMKCLRTGLIVPEGEYVVFRCDPVGYWDASKGYEVMLYDPGPDTRSVLDARKAIQERR